MKNVSFHDLQFDSSLTSLIALDSTQTHRRPLLLAQFSVPSYVAEIQQFIGMVNHLRKFIPHLPDLSDPLRQLLRKDSVWVWSELQQKAIEQIKQALVSPTVLAHYNPNRPTIISADASNTGMLISSSG